jgi:hypothetical protein
MATNNGRVTNRDLYEAITDLRKEVKGDIKDVRDDVSDLDERVDGFTERVVAVETKTNSLSKRVGAWDAGNTIGVIVAGILAYFGIKN